VDSVAAQACPGVSQKLSANASRMNTGAVCYSTVSMHIKVGFDAEVMVIFR